MKKKLLFKNTTQYSKKLYDEFTRFHNNKNSLSYDCFSIFILIMFIYCIYATIKAKFIILAILFIIMLIIFIGYRIFNPVFLYKKEVKTKAITKEQSFSFYFYDTYFKIRDNLDFNKMYYFRLYKVYETKKYFYLYANKKYSFILSKNGFTQGTVEEFSKFIKDKVWIKYSKYKDNSNKK